MPALDGIRILDMTQYEAGTSCTQALAWLGAEVVKVEAPAYGDPGRTVGVAGNYSPYFCNWNANKQSLALNLSKPEGREVFLRLLPGFDVFIENYGPGVVERLDLEYETLKKIHPQLIYAQIKGFGTSGPYADFKSYDMVAQASSGAYSVTGEPGGGPVLPGPTIGDSGTGIQAAMAILAAYIQRGRTGKGQCIEVSMQEAMTYFMRSRIALFGDWGDQVAPRTGSNMGAAPTGVYQCKPGGPNDWFYLITVTRRHWDSLCMAIEREDLIVDERFATGDLRLENSEALRAEIDPWMRDRTKHEALEALAAVGVPCAPILDTVELHRDPHLLERDFIKRVELPQHGEKKLLGFAPRMSESEVRIEPAPLLGEHTDDILRSELGLSASELNSLRDAGITR